MGVSFGPSLLTPGPDAISALLEHLTGINPGNLPGVQQTPSAGPGLPPPRAAQLPPQTMNAQTAQSLLGLLSEAPGGPQPEGQPGMFHRVVGNLLGIPHAIASHAGPAIPPEYKVAVQMGLIPQEVADAARPQFLSNIFDPEGYRNNLDKIMGVIGSGRTLAENQRLLAARRTVEQRYPTPTPTGDPERDRQALQENLAQKYSAYLGTGDLEAMKDIGSSLRGIMSAPPIQHNQIVPQGGTVVGPDGRPLYAAPVLPKDYPPQPYVSKNGNSTIWVKPGDPVPPGYRNAAQERTEITVQGANERAAMRPAGGGATGFGSAGIGGVARQAAAIVGLNNANERMTPFENAVATKTANYTGLDYWQGMRAKMYDAKGIKDEAIHADLYAKLNQENPDLANYLISAEQWALEDSQLSGRPSDFRTKLDAFVSAIGPRAGNKMIGDIQKFRSTRLESLNKARVAMEAIMARVAGPNAPAATVAAPTSSVTPTSTGGRTVIVNGKPFKIPD